MAKSQADKILDELEGDEGVTQNTEKHEAPEIIMVPIEDIGVDLFNRDITKEDVDDLARNINVIGLLVPIIVDRNNELVDGECRYKACKQLGWTHIPAILQTKNVPIAKVVANYIRRNVDDVRVIKAIKEEMKKSGMTQAKVAKMLGLSQGRISQLIGKHKPEEKKERAKKKKITQGMYFNVTKNVEMAVVSDRINLRITLLNEDLKDPNKVIEKLVKKIDFKVVDKIRR